MLATLDGQNVFGPWPSMVTSDSGQKRYTVARGYICGRSQTELDAARFQLSSMLATMRTLVDPLGTTWTNVKAVSYTVLTIKNPHKGFLIQPYIVRFLHVVA
jgi:hypothetical protein